MNLIVPSDNSNFDKVFILLLLSDLVIFKVYVFFNPDSLVTVIANTLWPYFKDCSPVTPEIVLVLSFFVAFKENNNAERRCYVLIWKELKEI